VQFTNILISRDTTQTDAPSTIQLNVGMQASFPSSCGNSPSCQQSFKQNLVTKILSEAAPSLTIPLADGNTLSCDTQLVGIVQNARESKYKGDDNF
jgi:hypothetical protein